MDIPHNLNKVHEQANKQKRTRSPTQSDSMSPQKKKKNLADILADISPNKKIILSNDSVISPGSCEKKRTDESSESSFTPRRNLFKCRAISGALVLADPVLELHSTIQRNYMLLKAKMEPTEIADKFYEKGIFDAKSMATIQKGNDRRMKNEIILKEMCRIKHGDRKNIDYDMFISILRETGQGQIASDLENSHGHQQIPDPLPQDRKDLMTFIEEMEDTILEEVEPKVFIDEVISICGLTVNKLDDINIKKKRRQRIQSLLELIKSAKTDVAFKIINIMVDAYPVLYEVFKDGNKGNRSKPGTSAANDRQLVSVGTPLQMTFKMSVGDTAAVQDTTEHSDPQTVIRKKKKEVEEIEKRIFNKIDENPEQLEALLESCMAGLEGIKFSSIKVFLKSLSKESLEKLMLYSSSKSAKKLLFSLIDENTKEKLADIKTSLVIEISKGCNDKEVRATFVKECFCHLKKETVTRHFPVLVEGMNVSKIAITRILNSKIIGDRTRTSLSGIHAINDRLERNKAFLSFYLQNGLPDVCLCILEEEVVKHGGSNIIRAMIKELSGSEESQQFELTKADIRTCIELLKEELEPRSFMHSLRKRGDKESRELLKVILTSESREERIEPFIEYLLRQNDFAWFLEELEIRNQPVYETLMSRRASKTPTDFNSIDFRKMQIAAQYFFDDVIEEVEPLILSKALGRNSQEELNISKLKSLSERSKRASGFFLTLLAVSESTFVDTLHAMTSCGYKDIVDSIKALVREGPLNDRYRCPHVLCLEQRCETTVYKETFTFDEKCTEGTNIPSCSTVRNREVDTEDIDISSVSAEYTGTNIPSCSTVRNREVDTEDIDISSVSAEYTVVKPQKKDSKGDKSSSCSSVIKLRRKGRALSIRGSESGVFSGSGAWSEEFNTDEDSDCEYSSSEVERRKMTAEWIKGQSP